MSSIPCVLAVEFKARPGQEASDAMLDFILNSLVPMAEDVERQGGKILMATSPCEPHLFIYCPVLAAATKLGLLNNQTPYRLIDPSEATPLSEELVAKLSEAMLNAEGDCADTWTRGVEPSLN